MQTYIASMERLHSSIVPPEPKPNTRNQAAVALSKLGASKGGKARSEELSKRRKIEIAKKAAQAR